MAAPVYTEDGESNGVAVEAERHLPKIPEPTGKEGGRVDKSDPARLGELLCGRAFESMFFVYQRLGRKEDPASHDACPKPQGIRLEAME